jgi:hypothetical protein
MKKIKSAASPEKLGEIIEDVKEAEGVNNFV